MKVHKRGILAMVVLLLVMLAVSTPVSAKEVTYVWKSVGNGNKQCYKNGKVLVKNQWVGSRHLNAKGYMDRNKWVTRNVNGVSRSVFVRDDGKWVRNFSKGWQEIKGEYYYYTAGGQLKTGWLKLNGRTFYIDPTTKTRVKGVCSIDGRLYYFSQNGVMKTNKTIKYQGRTYTVDGDGVCILVPAEGAPGKDMLFFQLFESGSEAYDQTGGDHGNACGAYQFDNRYSLLPFVKYAYSQNPTLCSEFKTYARYKNGTKLKSNQEFYNAWHKIYQRNPQVFAELQDKFAKENYYDPVETALARAGINLANRADVVKGAVYSYSIQHGQTTAVNAVKACKITASTTDQQFLKKLYNYRKKQFSQYASRYSSENAMALKILKQAAK